MIKYKTKQEKEEKQNTDLNFGFKVFNDTNLHRSVRKQSNIIEHMS